jgi:hypothetical protein
MQGLFAVSGVSVTARNMQGALQAIWTIALVAWIRNSWVKVITEMMYLH